jgi:hypothetical protein
MPLIAIGIDLIEGKVSDIKHSCLLVEWFGLIRFALMKRMVCKECHHGRLAGSESRFQTRLECI